MKRNLLALSIALTVVGSASALPQFSVLNDGFSTLNLESGASAPGSTTFLVGNFGGTTNYLGTIAGYLASGSGISTAELDDIVANFQVYAVGSVSGAGVFNFTSGNSYNPGGGTNFANEGVYALVYNAATTAAATEVGVFESLLQSFPSGIAPDETGTWSWLNSINEATFEVGTIVGSQFGDYDNTPQEFRLDGMDIIPEPASVGVIFAAASALGLNRRRRTVRA
jgi:hypothetical protein